MYKIEKCPFRITIAPSGGDNPKWCEKYKGHSYTASIDKYVYVMACKSPVKEYKLCYSEMESEKEVKNIKHSILKNILSDPKFKEEYWSVITWSDLPARAGLGSSAAFTISCLKAMQYDDDDIALTAFKFVDDDSIGPQDEYAVLYPKVNKFTFFKNQKGWKVDIQQCEPNNWHLYLLDSGQRRIAGDILRNVMYKHSFFDYRKQVEELGKQAFEAYIYEEYIKYKNILCKYNELKYKMGALSACDYATLTVLSSKYACKSVGAGKGGFYLIISEHEIDKENFKHGNLIPIKIRKEA